MRITRFINLLAAAAAAIFLLTTCSMETGAELGMKLAGENSLPLQGKQMESIFYNSASGPDMGEDADVFKIYPVVPLDEAFYRTSYDSLIADFLSRRSGTTEIASIIMKETRKNDLPISLTFSLAWAESRFNPFAVNWNEGSVDRGLFQLNNRSFPDLKDLQFFDPVLNTENGVAYLKYCLERGKNEVTALAMYNAGPSRVSERGAPVMTLDYIHKIMTYREKLEEDFQAELSAILVERSSLKSAKKVSYIVDRNGSYQ